MDSLAVGGGIGYLLVALFLLVLAILWFLLPFAVFGIKGRLDLLVQEVQQSNAELRKSNAELWDLRKQVSAMQDKPAPAAPAPPHQPPAA